MIELNWYNPTLNIDDEIFKEIDNDDLNINLL